MAGATGPVHVQCTGTYKAELKFEIHVGRESSLVTSVLEQVFI